MRASFLKITTAVFILGGLAETFARAAGTATLEPIVYTLKFPAPDSHLAEVSASVPTEKQDAIELMMPIWTPGYYRVENYADQVRDLSAWTTDGAALEVVRAKTNRWRINTGGNATIHLTYRLACEQRSVTRNWVGTNLAVLNGGATFVTLAGPVRRRPHEVRLELPAGWDRAMTGLDPAPDGMPNHFRAADYDTVVDSPIIAGRLSVHEFNVDGSEHYLVDAGDISAQWDGARAAAELEKMVREERRFWGFLPFKRYVFLNVFRQGGGGLEHLNSTLLTASPRSTNASRSWIAFVCHEYFHAFNVKRLRPAEIDSFDYENPPRTGGLWVSEGLTTYYGELLPSRAGLAGPEDFLSWLSSQIERLQSQPGRRVQTLEQASLEVWSTPSSGLARNAGTNTVSYYVKGPIVGFLLDARIQHATAGRASLDDVMRLAYRRYSGEHGFTFDQFRQTAEEIAGTELRSWFDGAIRSTEELDYREALDWFGLRFAGGEGSTAKGKLEIRSDATEAQRARWRQLTEPPAVGNQP
jgi:predicted metalloprotease with PDZ domain